MTETSALPLLYRAPRVLQPVLHGRLSLPQTAHYGFAAGANAVPLLAAEMAGIGRQLPIVFSAGDTPQPLVVLGLREGENLCVDAEGRWCGGPEVPAYLRRHPFIFLEDTARNQLTLCIDEAAPALAEGGEAPLFDAAGEPTPLTRSALAFCRDYQAHHLLTADFSAAVEAAGLLVAKRVDITLPDGRQLAMQGFQVIDAARFDALPAEQLLQWREKGWLPLVYSHLQSQDNWSRLLDREVGRGD